MYRRSTGRIESVSKDMLEVRIRVKLHWKNRNYVNSIFGGSMFSAIDPIPMMQLTWILGRDYVVWDRSAEIKFKRPGRETIRAVSQFTEEELRQIREQVAESKELDVFKTIQFLDGAGKVVCEIDKVMYVADKAYYKEKRKKKEG